MPTGRPYTYNCLDFDAMCELYFEQCDDKTVEVYNKKAEEVKTISQPEPYLKSGLALHLGLCTETMRLYSKDKDSPFFAIIKRSYDRIQNNLEMRAIVNKNQAVGCLFNLKCNHGMVETSKLDVTANVDVEAKIRAEVEQELLGKKLENVGSSSHAERILEERS